MKAWCSKAILCFVIFLSCCSGSDEPTEPVAPQEPSSFEFGADLSYVNQILDKGGVFKEAGNQKNPYAVFQDKGTTLARFRMWHTPTWTKEVYGAGGSQLYNELKDVERSISAAKAEGLKVLLDLHYSDTWADPGKQFIPEAWLSITSIDVLADSVYKYTFKSLQYLNSKGLLPEYIQLGNETNCGMLFSDAPQGFPPLNVCNGQWSNIGKIYNAGIKAVRDITANTTIKTKIILHVADPKNVDWWFTNIRDKALVSGYDIIGFSYYPIWHTTVSLDNISNNISTFKSKFAKDVMILETAYPWTQAAKDSYNNAFGNDQPLVGYPFTEEGQFEFMKKLTLEVKEGKGIGVIYWEPAWISSEMKDLWGTGSSWENCAFFNFDGNAIKAFEYMTFQYE